MKKTIKILALLFTGIISAQTIGEGSNTLTGVASGITGAASTIVTADLPANRAVISNGSGKIAESAVTTTELSYVSGVTSALQTQLNSKLNSSSYTAADVLSKLLTVDGPGSGLNADLLRGVHWGNVNTAISTSSTITSSSTLSGFNIRAQNTGFAAVDIVSDRTTGNAGGFRAFRTGESTEFFGLMPLADKSGAQLVFGDGVSAATSKYTFGSTGNFTATGSVSANNYITTSDERVKKNIQKLAQNDTTRLDIDWKTYNYLDNGNDYRVGVLAQELEIEHPEFVVTDAEGMKAVKYIDLLCAKVAELERRIEQLEEKNK